MRIMLHAKAFNSYNTRLHHMAAYVAAMTPCVEKNVHVMPLFVEGTVVLIVAHLQAYLESLISHGTRAKETALRHHFQMHGNDAERAAAQTCGLPTLVKWAKRRVSFENRGKKFERIFQLIFECSPWPSSDVQTTISDLILVRNVIVHADGVDIQAGPIVAAYVSQLKRKDLFRANSYGDFTVYHLEHVRVASLVVDALQALQAHVRHLNPADKSAP
jgi:hypothetical protein